jgi:cation:H+ antiporter
LLELITFDFAAIRKQTDVAFDNVIGSNIYNILFIDGTTAVIAPGEVPVDIASFDHFVMVGVSLLLVIFAWTGLKDCSMGRHGAFLQDIWVISAYSWPCQRTASPDTIALFDFRSGELK